MAPKRKSDSSPLELIKKDPLNNFVNPWLPQPVRERKLLSKKKAKRYFDLDSSNDHQRPLSSEGVVTRNKKTEVNQEKKSFLGNQSDEIYEDPKKKRNGEKEAEVTDKFETYVVNLRKQITKPLEQEKEHDEKKVQKKALQNQGGPLREVKYPGPAPIDPVLLEHHSRGQGAGVGCVRAKFFQVVLEKREAVIEEALAQGARAEVMLTENDGYLEADEGERTVQFHQRQIANAVDITTANKYFDLNLDNFGPYRMDYNRSGRYLLLGGRKGHVAAMDWVSKQLICEFNVLEEVFAIKWLHTESMFAVAQKDAVFMYNDLGSEVHCLRLLSKTVNLEFLPYHFLLVALSSSCELRWLDISIGKIVTKLDTLKGRPASMVQNPTNAVICVGHQSGEVTMWTPNDPKPVVKMLCDTYPVQAMDVDHRGLYLATSTSNRVRIWDLRLTKGCVQEYRLRSPAKSVSISQRGLLALGMGNVVEVYRDALSKTANEAYMRHKMHMTQATNMQFCPYEDVLGVGHTNGFTSLVIPGSGEPNYDALEANPYQTLSQRKEAEVKALLEKIQPEFITYDSSVISTVNVPAMVKKLKEAEQRAVFLPRKISLSHRKGKKGGAAKVRKTKEILYEDERQKFIKRNQAKIFRQQKKDAEKKFRWTKMAGVSAVLDRFQWERK